MTLDRSVMAFAGFMILLSLLLELFYGPLWLWLTAFVGVNLIQASFTGILSGRDDLQATGREVGNRLLVGLQSPANQSNRSETECKRPIGRS